MAYRERQKISQMTPKGANLEATDLLEVSELVSGSYVTKSITGQEIIDAASGGSTPNLQQVTDVGATTTNSISVTVGVNEYSIINPLNITTENIAANTHATLENTGTLFLKTGDEESSLKNTNVTNADVVLEFPDKATGSYTIATTSDIPSVTGYVPYTGATQDVDLGTNKISTKSVYITGTAGDGHIHMKHQSADATATGQSTAVWADTNGDIKWKNDGQYKTTLKTSSNTADRVYTFPDSNSTLTPDSRTINTNAPLSGGGDLSANRTLSISQATTSTDGYLSSTDWNTFNNKASYTPRVQSVTSSATVTPVNTNDLVKITAQAAALALANPTGSWDEGQSLMIRIKDNGTARAITYDTNYRAIGVTLPTTTVISKTTYLGIIYNSTDGKWDVIGVTTQA